jgi:hypothetical protein
MQLVPKSMTENVWEALSDAAIDWRIDVDGSTYVTSLDFPFWLDFLAEDEGFYFYTYCTVRESVGEAELLRFANECNLALPMIQFSASKCCQRFQAHYSLFKLEGIHQRSLLFAARRFAEIFMKVLQDEDNHVTGMDCDPEEFASSPQIPVVVH